jgi:hypothetical protein
MIATLWLGLAALPPTVANAAGVQNRTIGYVLTHKSWAVYETSDGKTECPHGFNDGPREQFAKLFPDDDKAQLTLLQTQLAREADVWFPADQEPATSRVPLPYYDAGGKIAIGLNLDGKIGPNDFNSPEGEPGIDNQLYRAIGCVAGFRGPQGPYYFFQNDYGQRYAFNRVLIEITDVDDLVNDPDVTVTIYRGLDPLLTSADGKEFISGGSQRIDERWGQRYIRRLQGKIVNGVLTTEPTDIRLPFANTFETNPDESFKAGRLRMKLTPTSAEGLLGAYIDINEWHRQLAINWATHHASYGQMSVPSITRALRRLADAYPDPVTGKNTAISSALELKFVQANIVHSAESIDSRQQAVATAH